MVYAEPVQSVMVPKTMIERAKELLKKMRGRGEFAVYGRMSLAAVVRIALERGMEVLEKELNAAE